MIVKIIDDIKGFYNINLEWKKLYEANNNLTIFQSFEWNYNFYTVFENNSSLHIIQFFNSKNLKIILPTVLFKGYLKFIGSKHSDYCSLIFSKLSENEKIQFSKSFTNYVKNNKVIKGFQFENLNVSGVDFRMLYRNFNNDFINHTFSGAYYLTFPRYYDYNSWLDDLPSKNRYELKRVSNAYNSITSKISYNNGFVNFNANSILELRKIMILKKIRGNDFLNKSLLDFIERQFHVGNVLLHSLYKNDFLISLNIILKHGNTFIFWIDLFNPDFKNINLYSYQYFIEKNINSSEETSNFDMGRGMYSYKSKNFNPDLNILVNFSFNKYLIGYLKVKALIFFKMIYVHLKRNFNTR